ncbi:hypothetical protein NPIL_34031 [Nephila pilipes]|uniref:Uncharacterized protein n=1 Tax=Nephila pilipes TaxID=299642 RepID=A0A8X6P4J9_NEPPI|nr:hypothetical protein NPIL_34031 [Nephila pilipes]
MDVWRSERASLVHSHTSRRRRATQATSLIQSPVSCNGQLTEWTRDSSLLFGRERGCPEKAFFDKCCEKGCIEYGFCFSHRF